MKLAALAAVTLAALSSTASADVYDAMQPPARSRGYVSAMTSGGVDSLFRIGGAIEGGVRIGESRLFARGQIGGGRSASFHDAGNYQQVRAGLEGRTCGGRPEALCAFAGADLAFTRDVVVSDEDVMDTESHAIGLVPRIGAEIGEKLRLRAAIEVPLYNQLRTARALDYGLAINLGVAYAF